MPTTPYEVDGFVEGFRSDEPGRKNGYASSHSFRSRGPHGAHRDERPKDETLYSSKRPPPSVAEARRRADELEGHIDDIGCQLDCGSPNSRALQGEAQVKWRTGAEYAKRKKEEELTFLDGWLRKNGGLVSEALDLLQDIRDCVRNGEAIVLSSDDKDLIDDLDAYVQEKRL